MKYFYDFFMIFTDIMIEELFFSLLRILAIYIVCYMIKLVIEPDPLFGEYPLG